MQPTSEQYNSSDQSHFPQLGIQHLSNMHSNELGFTMPFTSLSMVQPSSDESVGLGSPSPRGGPSPPQSPVPAPSNHGDTFMPDFANAFASMSGPAHGSLPLFSANTIAASLSEGLGALNPAPADKHRNGTEAYVNGEYLSNPASAPMFSSLGYPSSSPSSDSGPSTPGGEQQPQLFPMGFAQQHVALPPLSVPYAPPQTSLSAEAATGAQYAQHAQPSSGNDDEDSDDPSYDHGNDEAGLSAHEVKRRRLRRKAELARISRLSKKHRMNELEAENAMLRQQLAIAKQQQVASVGVGLVDLQSALQSITDAVLPALQILSSRTNLPATVCGMPLAPAHAMYAQPVNAAPVQVPAQVPAQAPSPTGSQTQAQSEIMTRRRRASQF